MTATAAKLPAKPLVTPLRAYFFVTLMLVLLVTAPFTVGVGVGRLCDAINSWDAANRAWAIASPLASWLVTGGLGFLGASYVLALCLNEKVVFKTVCRGTAAILGVVLIGVVLEYLFTCLPAMEALYDAFGAAGGTPVWLNGIASFVVVAFANILHVAVVVGILAAFACADFS
jgi:hypothetical protein